MVPQLVRLLLPSIPPMLLNLLLLHKSNPFFCPPRKPSLPRCAQPQPFPLSTRSLCSAYPISHQPPFKPLPSTHTITKLHPPPTMPPHPSSYQPSPASNHHTISPINASPHSFQTFVHNTHSTVHICPDVTTQIISSSFSSLTVGFGHIFFQNIFEDHFLPFAPSPKIQSWGSFSAFCINPKIPSIG